MTSGSTAVRKAGVQKDDGRGAKPRPLLYSAFSGPLGGDLGALLGRLTIAGVCRNLSTTDRDGDADLISSATARDMSNFPQKKKRPRDPNQLAKQVVAIAVGVLRDSPDPDPRMRSGGLKGGKARAAKLTADERKAIAEKAARARWGKR